MDRSQFLLIALLATVTSAVQLGCGADPSGEYRTFAESRGDDAPSADTPSEESSSKSSEAGGLAADRRESEPSNDVEPTNRADTPNDAVERSGGPTDPTLPIVPEMVPEEETAGSSADGSLAEDAAESVPATEGAPASAVPPADSTEPSRESGAAPLSPDVAGSAGSNVPGPSDVTGPATADPAATDATVGTSETPVPVRTIELLIPEKIFSPEGPEQALRVSYDDLDLLKVLNMEPVPEDAANYFPKWLSGLDGERIRIRGFMYPTFQETDLPGFVLARDNEICCFGRNPKIYDLIEVSLRGGVTTDYIQGRPFDVIGVLHIRPEADDGELYQLYQIDDAVVVDR